MKECNYKFLHPNIKDIFDTQFEIIGFSNGVYDLDKNEFRKGSPSDYITLSTNNEYNAFTYDSPEIIELRNIINKVLPIEAVREYFLLSLSSSLSGKLWQEKFYVLTGAGSNGKSVLMKFIKDCFGMYFHVISSSIMF